MRAAEDLVTNYQHVITDLRFVMGGGGVFLVTVDGAPIYDKKATGRHADPGEVLAAFADHVGPGVRRYGT